VFKKITTSFAVLACATTISLAMEKRHHDTPGKPKLSSTPQRLVKKEIPEAALVLVKAGATQDKIIELIGKAKRSASYVFFDHTGADVLSDRIQQVTSLESNIGDLTAELEAFRSRYSDATETLERLRRENVTLLSSTSAVDAKQEEHLKSMIDESLQKVIKATAEKAEVERAYNAQTQELELLRIEHKGLQNELRQNRLYTAEIADKVGDTATSVSMSKKLESDSSSAFSARSKLTARSRREVSYIRGSALMEGAKFSVHSVFGLLQNASSLRVAGLKFIAHTSSCERPIALFFPSRNISSSIPEDTEVAAESGIGNVGGFVIEVTNILTMSDVARQTLHMHTAKQKFDFLSKKAAQALEFFVGDKAIKKTMSVQDKDVLHNFVRTICDLELTDMKEKKLIYHRYIKPQSIEYYEGISEKQTLYDDKNEIYGHTIQIISEDGHLVTISHCSDLSHLYPDTLYSYSSVDDENLERDNY
jgi:hypothetical protein